MALLAELLICQTDWKHPLETMTVCRKLIVSLLILIRSFGLDQCGGLSGQHDRRAAQLAWLNSSAR